MIQSYKPGSLMIINLIISRYFYIFLSCWRQVERLSIDRAMFNPIIFQAVAVVLGVSLVFREWDGDDFLVSPDDQTFKIELFGFIQICRFRCLEVCGNMSFSHLVKERSDRIPRLCSALETSIPRHAQITLTIESSNSATLW